MMHVLNGEQTGMPELTASQAAQVVGVDRSTVFRWVQDGHVPARLFGLKRLIYIDIDDLRRFAHKNGYPFDEETARRVAQ